MCGMNYPVYLEDTQIIKDLRIWPHRLYIELHRRLLVGKWVISGHRLAFLDVSGLFPQTRENCPDWDLCTLYTLYPLTQFNRKKKKAKKTLPILFLFCHLEEVVLSEKLRARFCPWILLHKFSSCKRPDSDISYSDFWLAELSDAMALRFPWQKGKIQLSQAFSWSIMVSWSGPKRVWGSQSFKTKPALGVWLASGASAVSTSAGKD